MSTSLFQAKSLIDQHADVRDTLVKMTNNRLPLVDVNLLVSRIIHHKPDINGSSEDEIGAALDQLARAR